MWRALSRVETDLVLFCDGDNEDFGPISSAACSGRCWGPDPAQFAKATYTRQFTAETGIDPAGGGRVTELLARPLLEAFFPEAGELRQPLGGEIAASRELLAGLPFMTGYAVEAVMLIDVIEREGIGALAEVDLGSRGNDHQSLAQLGRMAREIVLGIGSRLPPAPRRRGDRGRARGVGPHRGRAAAAGRAQPARRARAPDRDARRRLGLAAPGERARLAAANTLPGDGTARPLHGPRRHAARARRLALP